VMLFHGIPYRAPNMVVDDKSVVDHVQRQKAGTTTGRADDSKPERRG